MVQNLRFNNAWNKGYQEYRDFARQDSGIFSL